MYWNDTAVTETAERMRLTLTWDVLKWDLLNCSRSALARLTLTWDVLKWYENRIKHCCLLRININMRCIEILISLISINKTTRLTLTWDVLKLLHTFLTRGRRLININMRCIEITFALAKGDENWKININMRCIEMKTDGVKTEMWHLININMRCIEMRKEKKVQKAKIGLTLTWDVLKCFSKSEEERGMDD